MAGTIPETGEPYIPRCTWLGRAPNDQSGYRSMKFRTRFASDANPDVCNSTSYAFESGPIPGVPETPKRDISSRPPWMQEQLVVSSKSRHSAKELCSSPTSWGPDFIDPHGWYCDMESKTLHALCSVKKVAGCVDVDGKALKKRGTHGKREARLKTYKTVTHW